MDASGTGAAVRSRLGTAELARFFQAVRRRLEEGGPRSARSVTLAGLSPAERQAVADLYGWKEIPEDGRRVDLARLDQALRSSAVGMGLQGVLEALGGPLGNRHQLRERARAEREALWEDALQKLADRPELGPWLEDLRTSGLVARLARAEQREEADLLEDAVRVARLLPRPGVLLQVLATDVAGDAHALDHGRGLSAVALRAAASLAAWPGVPGSAAGRRQLWAAVGVWCDPLSNDVLTFGLRPSGSDRLSRHLRESSEDGEPRRVTLRELTRQRLSLAPGRLFVCENPSVVAAAADRLGRECAPLVCVDGMPTTAAVELLVGARASGASILFHADFDWAGVGIANVLRDRLGELEPWRYTADDYRRASVRATDPLPPPKQRLASPWDPALITEMAAVGRAVYEEHVLESLLEDLAASP